MNRKYGIILPILIILLTACGQKGYTNYEHLTESPATEVPFLTSPVKPLENPEGTKPTAGEEDDEDAAVTDGAKPTSGEDAVVTDGAKPTAGEDAVVTDGAKPTSGEENGEKEDPNVAIFDPYDGESWIRRYSGDVKPVMTENEIQQLNLADFSIEGTGLSDLSKEHLYTVGEVSKMIQEYAVPDRKYLDNQELTQETRQQLLLNRNLEILSNNTESVSTAYGILAETTDLRSFPTELRMTSKPDGRFDYLQETKLLIGEAVIVLHKSSDGEWCFIQAENYCGWIQEKAIAYCSRKEMLEIYECSEPAVVTRNGLYSVGEQTEYLRMGTKFATETRRDGIVLLLPKRDVDGTLKLVEFYAAKTAENSTYEALYDDIHIGYLSYTRSNLIRLAVSLLGTPYGWGDALPAGSETGLTGDNGMDCSSTLSAVFRCFGIVMPRNTGAQRSMAGVMLDLSVLANNDRLFQIAEYPAGSLLFMPGHVMLYLGDFDGTAYILHNTTTAARDDGESDDYYCCCITTLNIGKTGRTLLDRLIQISALKK